jgi:steroid delta-isomerase-like uncharacterized protein
MQQGLDIVKAYYEYFNQKNYEGMFSLVSADIRHEVNQGEVRLGIEKYREFVHSMDVAYDETLTQLVYLANEEGTRFACEFVVNGIYKQGDEPPAHNQPYVLPAGAFLEIQDGKITRVTTYYNLPLWIKLVTT